MIANKEQRLQCATFTGWKIVDVLLCQVQLQLIPGSIIECHPTF